jgi:hypothetical protein
MAQNIEAINHWFRQTGTIIIKLRWAIILALLAVNIIAVAGLRKISFDTDHESWLLDDDPLTIAKSEFEEVFGNSDYASILVEADDVFAPDILRLIRKLGEELEEKVPFADEIVSITDLEFTRGTEESIEIGNIVPDEIPSDPQTIESIRALAFSKQFLVNRLFSDDSKQAWVLLRLNPFPDDWESKFKDSPKIQVGQTVLEIVNQESYKHYQIKPSGGPVINYQERDFFSREAIRLLAIFFSIAILALFIFLRTLRSILIPIITFLSTVLWISGIMGYLNIKVDNTVMTVPIFLGIAISIGYSIHILNFFQRSFLVTGKRQISVLYALQETGWPIFFTAATTIVALLSFYFVPIRTVRWMGLTSAAVVATTYLLVMTLTPALLSFGKNGKQRKEGNLQRDISPTTCEGISWADSFFSRFSQWIMKHPRSIMGVFIVFVSFSMVGLTKTHISLGYEKSYGLKIPFVNMLHYIGHTKIGSIYSYDMTLTFKEKGIVQDPDLLKNFDLLISEVKSFPLTKRVSSLLDVIKDMNQVMHADDPVYYRIPDDKALVAQLLLLYEMSNGTEQENWVDYDYKMLRLMVEVFDYDTAEMEKEFRYLEKRAKELFPDAKFGMVGMAMQFSVVQNYITKGEIISFFIALVVIGLLMMIVFRSVKTALIGMIPNLAPVFAVGGLMGYLDIPLDMTTMVILPILLGLAVDDTIHFISHSKLEFLRTGSYQMSMQKTFATVGKAIFMTSFILIVGFSVYLTSVATFIVHIGMLMIAGVLAALLSDYFITPILLNWFKPFGREKEDAKELD